MLEILKMTFIVVWLMSCPPSPSWYGTPKEAQYSLAAKGRVSVPNREAGNPPGFFLPKAQPANVVGWLGFDWTGTRASKQRESKTKQA